MYRARPELRSTKDLDQGDVLVDVLKPKTLTDKSFGFIRSKTKFQWPATKEALATLDGELRVVSQLEKIQAIVVSNSCDNSQGDSPILLAPIRPFSFVASATDDAKKWAAISQAATGTASPKLFYLPSSIEFKTARSEARLHHMFAVSHEYLQRCVDEGGMRRACGLLPAAQRHLQWAIGLVFSRNAREDDEWPSDEDLRLKKAWLESQLQQPSADKEKIQADLKALNDKLDGKTSAHDAVASATIVEPATAVTEDVKK